MPVVQALHPVQRVLHKRVCELFGTLQRTVVITDGISGFFGGGEKLSARCDCSEFGSAVWGGAPAGRLSLNALGPRATSGARPTGISSRNSLPALNAMPVVQVMQSVQRVLGKRAVAGTREKKNVGHKQPEFTSGVKRNARRASLAFCTACLAQTGSCGPRHVCRSRRLAPMRSPDRAFRVLTGDGEGVPPKRRTLLPWLMLENLTGIP